MSEVKSRKVIPNDFTVPADRPLLQGGDHPCGTACAEFAARRYGSGGGGHGSRDGGQDNAGFGTLWQSRGTCGLRDEMPLL
jgi:hypothetical protein